MPVSWRVFAETAPRLAVEGERLFRAFTLGYLATVRANGSPRLHPVTVTLHDGDLYVFPLPGTPKERDLLRDGRFALHSFPSLPDRTLDSFVDEEFVCAGRATEVDDEELRAAVTAVHNDSVGLDHRLFRLELDRAFLKLRRAGSRTQQAWAE
jgi:hypothetical protein